MKDQSNTIDEKNIASRDHTLHPRLYLILFHLFFLLLFLSRFIFILFIIIDNNPFSFRSSLSLFLLCVCVCVCVILAGPLSYHCSPAWNRRFFFLLLLLSFIFSLRCARVRLEV